MNTLIFIASLNRKVTHLYLVQTPVYTSTKTTKNNILIPY